uniref:LolE permease component of an ABC-transporter system n=1 Tax=uncultured bacterium CSL11 TaxID=1091566 RepID=G4WVE1_9BACT|nr:LolE permease component of an ABC-transporter system [uncultured bacterium CSL11]
MAFGIAALVVARGFTEWMFVDFREATIESQYAHLQITRPGFHEDGTSDPFRYVLPRETGRKIAEGVPHVRSLAPRLKLAGLVSRGDATVSFTGEGIDPAIDLTGDRSLRILQGSKLEPSDRASVLLGRGLAKILGASVGDNVVLLVNTPRGGVNALDARVVGIFASVSKAYDDSALLVSIDTASRLLKVGGAHAWLMYLTDTRHTAEVAASIRQRLDPKEFEVRTWDQLAEFYTRAVALLREQLGVVRIVVVAIILLSIANTMMMAVVERTGEIGTAMALGLRRREIRGQFLLEGSLIGVAGGLAGLLLALVLAGVISALGIEMPPPPSLTRGYVARVLFTPSIVLEALVLAVATTVLASLFPAWKASRMAIVDALRYNH